MTEDLRRHAPATERNREPIAQVLAGVLPASGMVLEIASGTGEHALHFARRFPALTWQPSDPSPDALRSIAAWSEAEPLANLAAPLELDAASSPWPVGKADAIVCINMIHISPWEATTGLMRGAATVLAPGAPLVLYGPYRRGDLPLEPSNAAFDESLKARDLRWGLRDVDAVVAEADAQDLGFDRLIEMPANNLMLLFTKR
jgi:SAM-dependent methyltransferase